MFLCFWLWLYLSGRYRGLEQWSARHFDLVKVSGSNPLPATT